jgi:hypothetical protein
MLTLNPYNQGGKVSITIGVITSFLIANPAYINLVSDDFADCVF